MSQAGSFNLTGGATGILTITGDAGGAVSADGANNISLLGSGIVTVTGTPGSNLLTIDATGVDQSNIYYVGKHGSDADSGLNINEAFLTFGAAIAAASSGDVITCFDKGTYTENLTGKAGVSINAAAATLSGAHTMVGTSSWNFGVLNVATATTGITFNSTGENAYVSATALIVAGIGVGIINLAGSVFFRCRSVAIENGFFVGNTTADKTYASCGEVTISGNGTAYAAVSGGELHVFGGDIRNIGAGNGTVFSTSGGGTPIINAIGVDIDTEKLSNITAASIVRATVTSLTGTAAESGAGTIIMSGATRIDEVPIGSVTPDTGDFTTVTATTPIAVDSGGTGAATLTDHGILLGSGTSAVTSLGAATNGQLPIGSTAADAVLANITSTQDLTITNGAGTISLDLTANTHNTAIHGWNGSLIESAAVTVTSDGATITFSVEKSGGGNLTAVFSDGFYDWTTAPDTIALTAGSDTSPQINYVYLLQSTKTLTVSTSAFPTAEHAPLATVLCQSAASLQTEGAYKLHAWTDHITDSDDMGHVAHLNEWIRSQNATWQSGVSQTLTITPNGGAPDDVIFTTASGMVLQLHNHVFPAFSGTPDVYTVNDSVTPYNIVTDLNALLTDSTGATMSGRYFSLVIWGVVSESTGDCKLMVNLPGGSYGTAATLESDINKYSDFSIPSDFKGTGFLISQLNLRHQVTASGTWTSIEEIDLRGLFPSLAAGGATSAQTEFADNTFRIFDEGDNTKELAFQVSDVTTATTRTITMDDRDIDLDAVPDSFVTPSGTATPSSGVLTFANGTNVTMTATGSTITVNSSGGGGGITWAVVSGTTQAMAIDTGYIANNSSLVTLTLPDTAAVGSVIRVVGKGDGGWTIAQNAGEFIRWDELTATSVGVGGSISSTDDNDAIEIVCMTADVGWVVLSSKGNLTIV